MFVCFVDCNRRLLLTGTPIQNNTLELFTLLSFLEPDVFTNAEVFTHHFGNLQDSEQVRQLQERIRPYVLRRMKESVEKSIPAKQETIVECELTMLQKKYYRAVYERNLAFLRSGVTTKGNMPKLLNIEMELRKCCIAEGTLVNMASGRSVPIEQMESLVKQEEVVAYDGPSRSLVSRPFSAYLNQGVQKCVELLFHDGRTLTCTPDHRVLTADGSWVEAQELAEKKQFAAVGLEFACDSLLPFEAERDWSMDLSASLGFVLDLTGRRAQTLALARLLGALASSNGGASQLLFSSLMDAQACAADVALLFGLSPELDASFHPLLLQLPAQLADVLNSLVGSGSSTPRFILHPECPIALVREYLGALFGGVGSSAPLLVGDKFSTMSLVATCGGSVATAVRDTLQSELEQLLQRFECSALSNHYATIECLQTGKAQDDEHLDSVESYAVRIHFAPSFSLAFQQLVGMRYAAEKQTSLFVAAAYQRGRACIQKQCSVIRSKVEELQAASGSVATSLAVCVTAAKLDLADRAVLHPLVQQWMPTTAEELAAGAEQSFGAVEFVAHMGFSHAKAATTGAADILASNNAASSVAASSIGASTASAIPASAESSPLFRVQCVGSRSVGTRQVYDLTVPGAHSFIAAGVCVHSQFAAHACNSVKRKCSSSAPANFSHSLALLVCVQIATILG